MTDRVIADLARLDQFINGIKDGDEESAAECRHWIMNAIATDDDTLLVVLELLRMATEVELASED